MFDFNKFLKDKFQSARGLISFLQAYGAPLPTAEMARKWFQRGGVPGEWFPVLLAYLEIEAGGPVRLSAYLIQERAKF